MITNKNEFFKEFCNKGSDPRIDRADAVKIWKWVQLYKNLEVFKVKLDMVRWFRDEVSGFDHEKQRFIIKSKIKELKKRV